MSGSVDDIEAIVFPEAGGSRLLNGNAALLLLLHEVGGRGSVVHLSDLVDLAGQFEDTFGCCGFARIHVGKNPDVPVFREVSNSVGLIDR